MRIGDLIEYVVWQVCRVASGARILYEDLLVSTNGRCENIENGLPTDLSLSHHDLQIPLGDRVVRRKKPIIQYIRAKDFFCKLQWT